jgi:hypothetical protein
MYIHRTFPDGPMAYVSWSRTVRGNCSLAPCYSNPNVTRSDWEFDDCVSKECTARDEFYSDPDARQIFKRHVAAVLSRQNTISGRLYRDDPTILGINRER